MHNKCKILVDRIARILTDGLVLSDDVLQFMDSTFGITGARMLEEITCDDADCQADSLMELIFFPDEALQIQVEEILSQEHFIPKDREKVLSHLLGTLSEAVVLFPDRSQKAVIPFPETAASQFLSRLKISKQLHIDLADSVNQHIALEWVPLVRVKLRNAGFSYTKNNISFLCDFFKALKTRPQDFIARDFFTKDFLKSFDFILGFLQELQTDTPIYPALMKKKRSCFQNLKKALKLEQQLKKHNIETLMLGGIRNPCINMGEMRNRIEIIDKIALSVFNRTESPDTFKEDVELKTLFTK